MQPFANPHLGLLPVFLLCACGSGSGEPSGSDAGASSGGEAGASAGSSGEENGGAAGSDDPSRGGTSVVVEPDTSVPEQPWDWAGVIGSGQSLAVGAQGTPILSTSQPFNNLKLDTGELDWPIDPADETLGLVPLVEPVGHFEPTYPSSWPKNIEGETSHTSMATQITSMVTAVDGEDYVGVHGEFGESGQCLEYLVKEATESGVNGRAYAATLVATEAVTRLAEAAGKSYGVAALIMTHGECDSGNADYGEGLVQLLSDLNTDIPAITGQSEPIQMIISQQNSQGLYSLASQAQWQLGVQHPERIVCSGPKYHLPYADDGIHLTSLGYQMLGEKYGQVYYERIVQGRDWRPLYPTGVTRDGQVLKVDFHVPVPPLAWETSFTMPQATSEPWKNGRGFEVRITGQRITIDSVKIVGDSVEITCGDPLPDTGVKVAYAMLGEATMMSEPHAGTNHYGQLRDSDPFEGNVTGLWQPNYAVAFQLDVP